MATTINAYSVSLGMDNSEYIRKSELSRAETRKLSSDLDKARTPAEHYTREQERLTKALQAGAISEEVYNRLLDSKRPKLEAASNSLASYAVKLGAVYLSYQSLKAGVNAVIDSGVAFVNHLKETQDQIDSVADAAGKLGVEYNELIGLRFAAQEAGGVEASSVDAGIKKMQIALSKGSKAFAELGLDVSKLKAAGAVEAFSQIADKFSQISSHADKLRLATEIFGKGGTELVSTLSGGRDAIAESVGFMEKWNALTPAQVLAVGQANDAWDRIGVVVDGITAKLASEFAAAMLMGNESALTMADAWKSIDDTVTVIVDNVVYQVGALKDAWEVLMALKGMPVAGAFEFDSGVKALDALYAKRAALEREANSRTTTAADTIEDTATERVIDREWEAMIDRVLAEEQKRIDAEQRIASTALKNADAHFQRERDNARKLRDDIAKGPQSMEAGSADAAKYMAEQANAAIAASMGLDGKIPTEEELLLEAQRQSEMMAASAENEARQVDLLQKLLEKKSDTAKIR